MSRCVISGCRALGEHLGDCNSDRCKGCRPRFVDQGFVCRSHRTALAAYLADIGVLDGQLREEVDPVDHQDWVRWPLPTSDPRRLPRWRWFRPARQSEDALAKMLPMGIVASSLGAGARVSGSKEPSAPTDLDRLDMTAAPRAAFPTAAGRANKADRIGLPSVAADLDLWVRDWRDLLFPGQHLPEPTVPALARWLADRLDVACDQRKAIDEFASEIRDLRITLRRKLGLNAPPRERCDGVPCKSCDRIALYREGGLVSCGYCGLNYSENEYRDWVKLEAPYAVARVRDGEVVPKHPDELRRMAV